MSPLLLALLLLVPPIDADDLVPAAVEALLQTPEGPPGTDIPTALDARSTASVAAPATARCLADLGDVTGDGAPDLAIGYAPGTSGPVLAARDGRSLAALWEAPIPGGGFRGLQALDARDGLLAVAACSPLGRVELRESADGTLRWGRDLRATRPGGLVNVFSVRLLPSLASDVAPDVLVAAGRGVDAVLRLSGRDGTTRWRADLPGPALQAQPAHDLDGDGEPDVAVAGGEETPYLCLLSGADGRVLWSASLDGPGSAVLPIDDVDDDGVPDVAAGQFAQPQGCVVACSGATGERLWTVAAASRDVTALRLSDDLLDTGVRDILVGSFDNAISAVLTRYGLLAWRREGSSVYGGAMLSVDATADLNGDGLRDAYAVSVDHYGYVLGGVGGQFMARFRLGSKGVAVLALGDGNGDGRPEIAAASNRRVTILDGNAGTSSGPVVEVVPPASIDDSIFVAVWAYPAYGLLLFASLGTADLPVAGFGTFGLDPTTLVLLHAGIAPGTGVSGLLFPPAAPALTGLRVHCQAATLYEEDSGALGPVTSFSLP